MVDNRYIVRLNPFEEAYLEKKNIGFSDFVHDSFYKEMKTSYLSRMKRIQYEIFLVLLGMMIIALAYTSFSLWMYLGLILVGLVNIILGFSTLAWEVRNGRRKQ